jgi:hypothetical protein
MEINAVTTCCGYDDLLAITLPRNLRHVASVTVVTSPEDTKTQELSRRFERVRCHVTDAFTRHSAKFNKGLALELAMQAMTGWILIIDADTLLPDDFRIPYLHPSCIYGCRRRILDDPREYRDGLNWQRYPVCRDRDIYGYFQLFNSECPYIHERPWYDVHFTHAGGCDAYFVSRFPADRKVWLPQRVLHLGPRDRNWFGRCTERLDVEPVTQTQDEMEALLRSKGWHRPRTEEPINDRIQVPGYKDTGFELK